MARPLTAIVPAILVLFTGRALGEDGRLARAQALFDEGRALVKRGDYKSACARFARSFDIEPGIGTSYHLADCWEHIGHLASAHEYFEIAATNAHARGQRERARLAHARAKAIEPRLLRLVIEAPEQPGLVVRRNGRLVDPVHFGAALPVDPGPYQIEAKLPNGKSWFLRVEIAPSDAETLVTVPELDADAVSPREPAR